MTKEREALKLALVAQPEQEPVAWVQDVEFEQSPEFAFSWVKTKLHDKPLYTTPPQRTWVDLTDEEIDFHLDKILKAAGSALKHYSMQKTKDDMRQALREALV